MILRRRFFLIGLFLAFAIAQGADQFKFPLTSNSVRFAVIGDMGTGAKPEFQTADQAVSSDLVLLDVKANLVVDYLAGILPVEAQNGQ